MRISLSLGVAVVVATAILAVLSCLPDLDALPALPDAETCGPAPLCGNGILDFDAHGGGEQCDPGSDAGVVGCDDCKVVCEGTTDQATGHCYFSATADGPDFGSAVNACSRGRAHVVTIGSEAEHTVVEQVASGRRYWVGLTFAAATEPAFTVAAATAPPLQPATGIETGWPEPPCRGPCTGCFGFGLDGGGFALPDGGAPPIDDAGTCKPSLDCVASVGQAQWVQIDCMQPGMPLATICERDPQGTIQIQTCGGAPCFSVRGSPKLYVIHTEPLGPNDLACDTNERLLHLDSDRERQELVRALGELGDFLPFEGQGSSLWIGLRLEGTQWVWDDGTVPAPDVHLWGDSQPLANAVGRAFMRLDRNYDSGLLYTTVSGTDRFGFVCESQLP